MDWLADPSVPISLLTLTVLEVVLGVDNVIFIAILTDKLPESERPRARMMGLGAAMVMRVALLFAITAVMQLTSPLFHAMGHAVSGRDLILIIGGLFLLAKATFEIHDKLEGKEGHAEPGAGVGFTAIIAQIMVLDIVFSLDSVITAVGMADEVWIMVAAVIIAVCVMLVASGRIAKFVEHHPTVKMLALAFLLLIGMSLVAEGFGQHVPKGYIYFAMGFSVFVELLNLRQIARAPAPIQLRRRYSDRA
ncbi:MAG TPA: TerC family protein [Acidobacteriota bacterium]|nr:TerC family protein [Acidobacteriota bacterium]